MIVSNHQQGTDEWLMERAIIPTTSEFDKIITATGKASIQATAYMGELLAAWYFGRPSDDQIQTYWMERGNALEPEARQYYELMTGSSVEQVGLCYRDTNRLVGASPDGLVGTDGLLEIKCPKASVMIGYMLDNALPKKYIQQVQGQLWVTGRKWCDFMAYHPEFDAPMIVRVEPDEKFHEALAKLIDKFVADMMAARIKLAPATKK